MRRVLALVAVLAVVAAGLVAYVARQHRYDFGTESFSFRHGADELAATLALPRGAGPFGLVVFVHGDGALDADHDGGYRPIWEALADAGYASVSWDKPGVGGSTGNWLGQTMQDRAEEALAAVEALAGHPRLDTGRLGLWGASQAGWVLPLIAERRAPELVIAASPAINWLEQGRYLAEQELADASPEVRALAGQHQEAGNELLRSGASYEEYRRFAESTPPELDPYVDIMSAERWRFVSRNFDVDARDSLPSLRDTPVLLQLAGRDRNVDVAETEAVYRDHIAPRCLTVGRYPGADHSLVDDELAGSDLKLLLTFALRPRAVLAHGVLRDVERFARTAGC